MAKTHFSGPVAETGTRNSQDTTRTTFRTVTQAFSAVYAGNYANSTDSWGGAAYVAGTNLWGRLFTSTGARTPSISLPVDVVGWSTSDVAETTIGELTRGIRIERVDHVYTVGVANLTSVTLTLETSTVTHEVAPTAVDGAMTTAAAASAVLNFNAQPKVVTYSVTTPVILTPNMFATLGIAIAIPNTSTFTQHGIILYGSMLL